MSHDGTLLEMPQRDIRVTVELSRDGNQICALLGRNLQEGISGFGDTPAAALRDLARAMEAEGYQIEGLEF